MTLFSHPSAITSTSHARRRAASGVLAAALLLAVPACSSGGEDGSGSNSGSATDVADGEFRTVTDSEGNEVEVPANPQTIVTLHFAAVQALLDLGTEPAGQNGEATRSLLTEEQFERMKDVTDIGRDGQADLEAIAALEPDLILVPNMVDEEMVEKLRELAPSYIYTHSGPDRANWSGRVAQIADAINRTDRYEELEEELRARQEDVADTYGDELADRRVAFFASYNDQEITAMGSGSMAGEIITPAGARFADGIDDATRDADGWEQAMSAENLSSVLGDADVVFYGTGFDGATTDSLDTLMESTAFRDLEASRQGEVYPLGKGTIAGFTDAFDVLDNLEAAVEDASAN
ncbi:ABC transporter substrate-binding protein [Corynebacterium sp. AOP40-9SA-29]|uniref:ABC transporter substrate-binding protein n=1 Tax=Corynebacterium sp. AOP40-9SA-29 TaxID=3457677 RepID=UPI004033F6E2